MDARFVKFDAIPSFQLAEGIEGRPLFGERAMINLLEFQAGAVVPSHSHPHEQLGIVLRGTQILEIDGTEYPIGPMEGYVLPGGIEHAARCGPEGATVIDVFHPVRDDYRALVDESTA